MFGRKSQLLLKGLFLSHSLKLKPTFKIVFPTLNAFPTPFYHIPIYSFSSSSPIIDFKSELSLLPSLSREQQVHASKVIEKYTAKYENLKDLTSREVEWISFILYELAVSHRNQGNSSKALRYVRENEDLFKTTVSKPTFLLAQNYFLHVCLDMDQKNYTNAEHTLAELERICKSLGEDKDAKSLMLQGWCSLAEVYLQSNHHDKALQLFHQVLENIHHAKEEAVPNLQTNVYQGLGTIYSAKKDIEKTMEYWTKSFEIVARHFGEYSPMAFSYFQEIPNFLYENGQYSKALQYANKNLEIALKAFPKETVEVGSSYLLLGHILFRHADYTKALVSYKKALEFYEKSSLPEQRIFLRDIYFQLVQIHALQNEPQKASVFLAKADHALLLSNNGNQELFAQVYDNWAHELVSFGNMIEEARTYFGKALDLYKGFTPPNRARIQAVSGRLGLIAYQAKEWSQAYEYFKESERHLDENQTDPETSAGLCSYISTICINLRNYDEAERYLQKVLQSSKKIENIGLAYSNLGVVHELYGMKKEALEDYQKSLEYLSKDDPAMANILQIISEIENELKVENKRFSQVIETGTNPEQK